MKKILFILTMLLSYGLTYATDSYTVANKDDDQVAVTASVINPLDVSIQCCVPELPVVIIGSTRNVNKEVKFNISGDGGRAVTLNTSSSVLVDEGVTLLGSWDAIPAGGFVFTGNMYQSRSFEYKFKITGLQANAGIAPGPREFLLEVKATYSEI